MGCSGNAKSPQSGLTNRELGFTVQPHSPPKRPQPMSAVKCPQCDSEKLYRDGFRYLADGSPVQRWLCRDCGYRFSENGKSYNKCRTKSKADAHQKAILMEVQKELEKREAGATEQTTQQADIKGKLLEFAWQLKKEGVSDTTIKNYTKFLKALVKKGASLSDPDSVKHTIAVQETWGNNAKALAVHSYNKFAENYGIKWNPPKYKTTQKLPFIPLESEIDSLIACCGRKTATILQIIKETGMRIGEAVRLKWIDVDLERRFIMLNEVEKSGKPRMFKISEKLTSMINMLPRKSERIFNRADVNSYERSFSIQRKRAVAKLQNPRLLRITFHTIRHWKATMEYYKTKDILHVKEMLGHRSLNNTLIYTQLVNFEEENAFHSAVAKTLEEAKKLVEAGFEYVCDFEDAKLFRKRK